MPRKRHPRRKEQCIGLSLAVEAIGARTGRQRQDGPLETPGRWRQKKRGRWHHRVWRAKKSKSEQIPKSVIMRACLASILCVGGISRYCGTCAKRVHGRGVEERMTVSEKEPGRSARPCRQLVGRGQEATEFKPPCRHSHLRPCPNQVHFLAAVAW